MTAHPDLRLLGGVLMFLDTWDQSPTAEAFAEMSLVRVAVEELREIALARAQEADVHWPSGVRKPSAR